LYKLKDGTIITVRETSKSGGPAISINPKNIGIEENYKLHIKEGGY
jgi:hypothetical protein